MKALTLGGQRTLLRFRFWSFWPVVGKGGGEGRGRARSTLSDWEKKRGRGRRDIFPHLLFGRGTRGLFSPVYNCALLCFSYRFGCFVEVWCGERKKESLQFKIDDQKIHFWWRARSKKTAIRRRAKKNRAACSEQKGKKGIGFFSFSRFHLVPCILLNRARCLCCRGD